MTDIDAYVDEILAREEERRRRREKAAEPAGVACGCPVGRGDPMLKAIHAAFARAEKAHRLANEQVEIKAFEC